MARESVDDRAIGQCTQCHTIRIVEILSDGEIRTIGTQEPCACRKPEFELLE